MLRPLCRVLLKEDTFMKLKYTRILSLVLCAAVACSVLAGCGTSTNASSGSKNPEASSSAPASDSASASSEELPESTSRADTSGLNPVDFDENSIFSITGTSDAFDPCLGWGPGVSGCSLKSVIAAASLLQWAENARLASRTEEAVQDAVYGWYDNLSSDDQESFAEAWPMIESDALSLLSDKESMTGRIEDAGLDPDTLPGCTLKNWQVLQSTLDGYVPDVNQ